MTAGDLERGYVLLVDENEEFRAAMAALFEMKGLTLATTRDGAAALDLLDRSPRPAAVITDLSLPRMTGWELCERLSLDPRYRGTPIIVVSALPQHRVPVDELRASVYLQKPVDIWALLRAVTQWTAASQPT